MNASSISEQPGHHPLQDVGEGIIVALVLDPFGNVFGIIENRSLDNRADLLVFLEELLFCVFLLKKKPQAMQIYTVKLISIIALAMFLSQCKATTEATNTGGPGSMHDVLNTLDTVEGKFIEIAKTTPGKTPGDILVLTTDWLKTQPEVKDAYWFDSTYIYIEMKTGLRTVFMLYRGGNNGTSLSRGGPARGQQDIIQPMKSNNLITNKNVLIYAPFVGTELADLYKEGELDKLSSSLKNSDLGLSVTRHEYSECTLADVDSFGYYGLVILSTHGIPDGFVTGQYISYDPKIDSNEEKIKEQMDYTLGPGGYEKVSGGDLMFCHGINIPNQMDWQTYLEYNRERDYRIIVTSEYVEKLPAMPGTVILANMCYSGWSNDGEYKVPQRGMVKLRSPIRTAFTDRDLISYYAYGYSDGTSQPVDNDFAKRMEDSLVKALAYDKDSTGNAYLNTAGNEYTAGQLTLPYPPISSTLPLKHWGADDYSYDDCIEEFTDDRDQQKYKAVCIGKQTWMAENLNYNAPGSKCYDDKTANCDTYGRLYDWQTLMQGASSSDKNPSGVQGICPKGWHVPSKAEWQTLVDFVGGVNIGGGPLKDTSSLWISPNKSATNSSGFTALPAGLWKNNLSYSQLGESAYFWTTTDWVANPEGSYYVSLANNVQWVQMTAFGEKTGTDFFSCRCLKD